MTATPGQTVLQLNGRMPLWAGPVADLVAGTTFHEITGLAVSFEAYPLAARNAWKNAGALPVPVEGWEKGNFGNKRFGGSCTPYKAGL